jgi:dTDP-4-amino-4,6-dideoxygalactose transaminase
MISFSMPYRPKINRDELFDIFSSRSSLVGGSYWSRKCTSFLAKNYNFSNSILTTSCTDALEIAFALCDLKATDNVIVPGFTFVSSILPATRYTKDITFSDVSIASGSCTYANIIEKVKSNTKVIVAVNYAGVNEDIIAIRSFCDDHDIFLIEDAAQSIGARIENQSFGSFGHFATMSFHDTKNINSGGEGGCLIINDNQYVERAHVLSEKGTNRREFSERKVDKYEWLDYGSSHVMSDLNAFLLLKGLQQERVATKYRADLAKKYEDFFCTTRLNYGPYFNDKVSSNGHIFYLLLDDANERAALSRWLLDHGVQSASHYLNLANSPFARKNFCKQVVPMCDELETRLLRLPLHNYLSEKDIEYTIGCIERWIKQERK